MHLSADPSRGEPLAPGVESSSAGQPTQRLPPLPADGGEPHLSATSLPGEPSTWRVAFKVFKSTFQSWEQLFTDAAAFATAVGPERLITIAHSADQGSGVVTVWFWADWREG
jgi:hypothetical protein